MSYRPDPLDCLSRTPIRGTRGPNANEWSTPRFDPNGPLLQLLDGQPRCAGSGDPDLWIEATRGHGKEAESERRVLLRVCEQCPVKNACLEFAITWEMVGIWGGTTTRQRGEIRQQRYAVARKRLREAREAS